MHEALDRIEYPLKCIGSGSRGGGGGFAQAQLAHNHIYQNQLSCISLHSLQMSGEKEKKENEITPGG